MIIFNNGPGSKIGFQIGTLVTKGGVPVAPEDEEIADVAADDDGEDDD